MLTQNILTPLITDINPNTYTVSICKVSEILQDGVVIAETSDRRAFVPGEIELVKSYIGVTSSAEITYLNALWTQDVIDAYNVTQRA